MIETYREPARTFTVRCSVCGGLNCSHDYHACGGTPTYREPATTDQTWKVVYLPGNTPHKCPACDGWGKRYRVGDVKVKIPCTACDGKGVVWEP